MNAHTELAAWQTKVAVIALVCAAKGWPPLRNEPHVATQLDEQLDGQTKKFLAESAKNRVDARSKTIYLSPIFKWFSSDFEAKSGTVLAFWEAHFPESDRKALAQGDYKIRYTDYDWSFNDQR